MFELREQGMDVQVSTVIQKADSLSREFQNKSSIAQYIIVRRFVKSQRLVYLMGTHGCQKYSSAIEALVLDFMEFIRPKLIQLNRHKAFIINMDQAPVFFI